MNARITHLSTIAREAASVAAEYLRGLDRSHMEREYKLSAQDIVTVHDKKAELLIREVIAARIPGARIVGEEGGVSEPEAPGDDAQGEADDARVTFYVDPIDGTSNFAAGMPLFAVSIGVAIDEVLVAGVINAPILEQEFWSDHTGAYLGERRLGPHRTSAQKDALVLSSFPGWKDLAERPEFALEATKQLKTSTAAVRALGTAALELAYVAAGWADAAMLSRIASWDVAAGYHLVRQAGGSLRTWSGVAGETPEDSPIPEQLRPAYVACKGVERLDVLDTLQQHIHERRGKEGTQK